MDDGSFDSARDEPAAPVPDVNMKIEHDEP
jgi:hypothetical protein